MEEGTKNKKTIFIGGIDDAVNETDLFETFSTFGDIIDVQLPTTAADSTRQTESKHRGFAFVTFASQADAQDAIDNMDMNVHRDRVLRVNLAKPMKNPTQPGGNRPIWESEDWLQKYAKPLSQSGGVQGRNNEEGGTQHLTEDEAAEEDME